MITCKDCTSQLDSSGWLVYTLCEPHRSLRRKIKKQYDEFYRESSSTLRIAQLGEEVFELSWILLPASDLGWNNDDSPVSTRSDIPVPDMFNDNIRSIIKSHLQPKEKTEILGYIHNKERALASWDYNQTFDWVGDLFEEEYDMDIVKQILELLPNIKQVKRIR